MFNFLSFLKFFKKKPIEPSRAEDKPLEPVIEKQIQIDDIAIHTMPERFRHQPHQANQARTAGLLIVGGGVVFLILISAGLYFYLFKKPAPPSGVKPELPIATTTSSGENQVQPEIVKNGPGPVNLPATTTPLGGAVLPTENGLATSTATSTPATIEPETTVGLTPGLDSDNDGLTDAEEVVLKTGTSTPDTDGDGYPDGAELLNLYDPAGPGKLATNPNLALYENKTFNYTVLYPAVWQLTVNGGDDSIMFKTADNQFLQVVVQPNTGQESLDQWYMDQLGVATINDSDRLSGPNWQGLKNLDGLILYLTDLKQKYIFTLAYNPGENNILEYLDIFKMMIKSFVLKE